MFKIQWYGPKLKARRQKKKGDCAGPEVKGACYDSGRGNEKEGKDGRKVVRT